MNNCKVQNSFNVQKLFKETAGKAKYQQELELKINIKRCYNTITFLLLARYVPNVAKEEL